MSRRLVIAGVAVAALSGAAVPAALASTGSPVTVDTSNGVQVGVHNGNTPIAAVSVTPDGQACAGIGLQVPVCTPGVGSSNATRQKLPLPPVVLRHDDTGTAVGVGDVGVVVSPSGRICPVVSTQDWQCVGGDN